MYYPVLINFTMAVLFGLTLIYPPSAIERIARIKEPNLDKYGVIYTKKVTMIWCLFCLLNTIVSLFTVLNNNLTIWILYNGFISYILMGMLFLGEIIFRMVWLPSKDIQTEN